jgi:6-pyruvoyltetrahydropterin/6-carboxytetrahydropterin synthase
MNSSLSTSRYCVTQKFHFDAAHTLKREIEADSSKRIHGHTYFAEITLCGQPDAKTGMVIDLGLVRQEIEVLRERLDHHMLDDVQGLGIPTLENICQFIANCLEARLRGLTRVKVWRDSIGDGCELNLIEP